MDGNLSNAAFEVVDYPLKIASKQVKVVGSCNGLLCIVLENGFPDVGIVFIWNPSTRKFNTLASDGYFMNISTVQFSFGYDAFSGVYKVVAASNMFALETFVKIYSMRDGSWKDISVAFSQSERLRRIKLLNGVLHWMVVGGDRRFTINSLDLATETYGEIVQPVYDEGEKDLLLGTLGDSLCVLCDYREVYVDVWVMKACGVKDSWTKVVSVPYPETDHFFEPVCISNDGKVLFILGRKLMIYDSNDSSFSDVKDFDKYVEASTFVESLVSPMPPAATTLGHRVAGSNE